MGVGEGRGDEGGGGLREANNDFLERLNGSGRLFGSSEVKYDRLGSRDGSRILGTFYNRRRKAQGAGCRGLHSLPPFSFRRNSLPLFCCGKNKRNDSAVSKKCLWLKLVPLRRITFLSSFPQIQEVIFVKY